MGGMPSHTIDALKSAIIADLADGKWAREVANARNVTLAVALRLEFEAESTNIGAPCAGSGKVSTSQYGPQPCNNCGGLGWF